jgi:profilin
MKKLSSFLLAVFLFVSTLVSIVPSASAAGWQDYVDIQLLGSGKVLEAAIVGLNGGVWAHSEGFEPSTSEIKALADSFNNLPEVSAKGFYLNGLKYFTLQAQPDFIYGKRGASGVTAVKTKQGIVIGTYDGEKIQLPESAPVVQGLGSYLRSVNY